MESELLVPLVQSILTWVPLTISMGHINIQFSSFLLLGLAPCSTCFIPYFKCKKTFQEVNKKRLF